MFEPGVDYDSLCMISLRAFPLKVNRGTLGRGATYPMAKRVVERKHGQKPRGRAALASALPPRGAGGGLHDSRGAAGSGALRGRGLAKVRWTGHGDPEEPWKSLTKSKEIWGKSLRYPKEI